MKSKKSAEIPIKGWLGGFPARKHIALLGKPMNESHMRHLSRFRLIRSRIASFNDREVNVVVDVNIFYSDPQAR